MSRICRVTYLCIFIIILAACMPTQVTTTIPTLTVQPKVSPTSVFPSAIMTTSIITPEVNTPTITPTSVDTQPDILTTRCIDIKASIPVGQVPGDLVVLNARGSTTIWDLANHQGRKIQSRIIPTTAAVSPDGTWLAYNSDRNGYNIIVFSSDGKKQFTITPKSEWETANLYWLGNQYLQFPVVYSHNKLAEVDLINPFTGEVKRLYSNFPGMEVYLPGNYGMGGGPPLNYGNTSVLYNPNLDLAIYPETIKDDGAYTALYDIKAGRVIAKIYDGGPFKSNPQWLPDGSQFVVFEVGDKEHSDNYQREWIFVNRDGKVKQLTRFGDYYTGSYFIDGRPSISPDGNYLAFLFVAPDDKSKSSSRTHFFILNLKTLEVVDACLGNMDIHPYESAWSLDSKYLVIGDEGDEKPAVLINVDDWWAVYLEQDQIGGPIGWMKKLQ